MPTTNTKPSAIAGSSQKKPSRESSTRQREANIFPPALSQEPRLKRPVNSNRTGGPRTSEGRARSALNSIKHGGYVTARSAGIEFQSTLSELISRVNPVGVIEDGVVHSLAVELFRISTLGKLELERVQAALNAEVSTVELAHALDYPWLRTHPEELRNPPPIIELRRRLSDYLASQLSSLLTQHGASPSAPEARKIEALKLAVADMLGSMQGNASEDEADGVDVMPVEHSHEPAYFDELDRHMRELVRTNELLNDTMALPSDTQPLVDYWLLRNYYRIEATRRELQVAGLLEGLTNENVRRARSHAMRQLDDCVRLLEQLRGGPVTLGSVRHAIPSR